MQVFVERAGPWRFQHGWDGGPFVCWTAVTGNPGTVLFRGFKAGWHWLPVRWVNCVVSDG